MGDRAATYDLIQDHGFEAGDEPDELSTDVYWAVAIVRLGLPLSFSRATMDSVTKDLTQGAMLRADKPLVITDDFLSMKISGSKGNHKKSFTAQLKQTDVNYLVEILPGDWVLAWLTNNKTDMDDVLTRLDQGKACNRFNDGLKFVGRVASCRKAGHVDREHGYKTAIYNLSCAGFEELDSNFFYDNSLASKDTLEKDMGQWLTRLGIDVQKLFSTDVDTGIRRNNVNIIVPTLLDLIVGKGPGERSSADIKVGAADDKTVSAAPQVSESAPYSYMIPAMVGQLLGKTAASVSKHVLGYSDILELVIGVQKYSNKSGPGMFSPDFQTLANSTPQRRVCPDELLGTFLPYMPDFANKPLWSVFQQYLNPTINEMYTCLRTNPDGDVVPTIVMRQIPFTTDAFKLPNEMAAASSGGIDAVSGGASTITDDREIAVTKFLDVPRWYVPNVLINGDYDIGRSDATRINFVHVYGTSSYQQNAVAIQEQIVFNPPVMDHLDIMRSGMRPYMATVECWVADTVGKAARSWMTLVADWSMGSQYTLNGTLDTYGIQSPICEGDNLEFDNVVYHIESVSHSVAINATDGKKSWRTQVTLVNGMRKEAPGEDRTDTGAYPIYPGFASTDNTDNDPGLTLEQNLTTGGVGDPNRTTTDPETPTPANGAAQPQLDPASQDDASVLKQISPSRL